MKTYVNLLLMFALCCMAGCKKDSTPPGPQVVYEQTISDLKKNEPLRLTFSGGNSADAVVWTVNPSTNVTLNALGNAATLTFRTAGAYTVLATAGTVSAKYIVNVNNTDYIQQDTAFNVRASKLVNILYGETVTFSAQNISAGRHLGLSPYGTAGFIYTVDTANNTASLSFTSGGFAAVTASDGIHTQRRTVWLNDPANSNPNYDTVSFIVGEKLQLTPSVQVIGGTRQLLITAATQNSYACSTDKILSFALNSPYTIDYSGVAISTQSCSQPGAAKASNGFTNVPIGTHVFTINFGNQTFTGSLQVSAANVFTFTWPDQSIVSISPLVVQ